MASSSIHHLRLAADEIPRTLEASSSSASYSSDDAFVPVFRPDPSASSASAAASDRVRSQFLSVMTDLFCDMLYQPAAEHLGFTEDDAYDHGDASIHWDCLELEDAEPDLPLVASTAGDEFEWEEVASASGAGVEPQEPEWEVLGHVPPPAAATTAAEEGFVYTSDREAYEVLVAGGEGQFLKNKPPAARSAVEALPSAVVAAGEEGEGEECVVCRDGVAAGQRVKRLPCSHRYHEECMQWLQVRNSCPLCRFELPTDDPEYETWKAGRAVSA
ncbi:hypothetical protein ACP70R_001135 [Stipagrostis hirtigluma subsp. patula]